ncbi:Cytochrome b5 OS=Mortierella alpina PE=1 SV=1 [Rhizoctonia solani AG-1 IB]|uniref:Cytochrome b5 n=1 Tax=Thanatephorus cucumeris (strain AG1-IB / isolate 7/3/14) TaxID=1108050 RepID=A0A0B7FU38_THACB|nr:Cytochrome b5 OS=Mortierella alpina PE=1 SV=1 [Rhizoctonia solani AG-1 IB]
MSAKITLEQLKQHTKKDDFYALIHGKVYDVTKFLDEHPGGDEVIMAEGGKDATEAFEDVGHSDEARDILKGLYVGDFEGGPITAPKITPSGNSKPSSSDSGSFTYFIPLAALGAYFAWRFYFSN